MATTRLSPRPMTRSDYGSRLIRIAWRNAFPAARDGIVSLGAACVPGRSELSQERSTSS